jgi:secondary thiamine-phosphate synthase enzyme
MLLSLLNRGVGPCLSVSDRVRLRTRRGDRFVDLTELVDERVRRSGVASGVALVQSLHTTAAQAVNENEPLLLTDLERTLDRLAPAGLDYAHDDLERRGPLPPDERRNGAAHCRALVLAPSLTLLVEEGRLVLGRWQRILFVELDPPGERDLAIAILGTATAKLGRRRPRS